MEPLAERGVGRWQRSRLRSRSPRSSLAPSPLPPGSTVLAYGLHLTELRLNRVEARLERIEARLDKMADALAPALHAWRNIKKRIPAWILSMGETPPSARELPADDSENE